MNEKNDVQEKKPFMYIVQPEFVPPKTKVQSEIRVKKTHHDEIVEVEDIQSPITTRNPQTDDESKINIISITNEETLIAETTESGEVIEVDTSVEAVEAVEAIKTDDHQDNEITEIVVSTIQNKDFEVKSDSDRGPGQRKRMRKKFSEMSKNELIDYLIKIPIVVPKPFCEIKLNGKIIRGQIEKKKGDLIFIKPSYGKSLLGVKEEEIEYIKFLNF